MGRETGRESKESGASFPGWQDSGRGRSGWKTPCPLGAGGSQRGQRGLGQEQEPEKSLWCFGVEATGPPLPPGLPIQSCPHPLCSSPGPEQGLQRNTGPGPRAWGPHRDGGVYSPAVWARCRCGWNQNFSEPRCPVPASRDPRGGPPRPPPSGTGGHRRPPCRPVRPQRDTQASPAPCLLGEEAQTFVSSVSRA